MRHTGKILLLSVALAFLGQAALAQGTGSIQGVVLDDRGSPVANAVVTADPVDGLARGTALPNAETDTDGRFVVEHLAWLGKYRIYTAKQTAGYPDTSFSFYSNDVLTTAEISAESPTATIRIQLGPKAGALVGAVSDAETGKPVPAGIELRRTASPDDWLSTSVAPNYRVLLPSSVNVSVVFVASGYEKWTVQGPLNLQPGQEMRLDVALQPAHNPALQASQFLIPDGYVGWLLLVYGQKDTQPSTIVQGATVFKFPPNGILKTSSPGPERGADRKYLYYSQDESLRDVPMDYKNGGGMVWGEYEGTRAGVISEFGFFVGTEDQYEKAKNHRPIQ